MLLCYLDKVVGFPVPRSKASFPVPVPCSRFRFLVPGSGSSLLVYRFITPSPPSEKEASHIVGIIYTIIFLKVGPGNAGPKIRNSLNLTSTGGVARKKNKTYHAQGTVHGLPGTGVLPVVRAFVFYLPLESFYRRGGTLALTLTSIHGRPS